ncbi:MAG TPA: hypothetical protein VGS11_10255 [Candidatus Bathyarchaeia archaeon]|nr:hypothetical protein [Candidatus Bathyarchaeia archaeon]
MDRLLFAAGVILAALSLFIFMIPLVNAWRCANTFIPYGSSCIGPPSPIWPSLLIMPVGLAMVGYSFRKTKEAESGQEDIEHVG